MARVAWSHSADVRQVLKPSIVQNPIHIGAPDSLIFVCQVERLLLFRVAGRSISTSSDQRLENRSLFHCILTAIHRPRSPPVPA